MAKPKVKLSKIVVALLVILLCLVFIVGATVALFTSNDGKIGINATAGDLEVDIVDAFDTSKSLVGDVLDFDVDTEDGEVLFEPGATFYTEGFRVKNDGNISLNFIIYISEDDDTDADFNEAFDVWVTKDPQNDQSVQNIQDFDRHLKPGEISDIYYLVCRMKTDAGNEYQKRTFTGVGITVCAVQGNVNID